jgi:hypothetical protein
MIKNEITDEDDYLDEDEDDYYEDDIDINVNLEDLDDDRLDYDSNQLDAIKSVSHILKKVKKIVNKFNKSTPLTSRLREVQNSHNSLTLINDIKIRWNSSLLMIQRFLCLYDFILKIIKEDNDLNKSHSKYLLTSIDMLVLECLIELLQPFKLTTDKLSKGKYVTIDLSISAMLYSRHKILSLSFKNDICNQLKSLLLGSFNFYVNKYEVFSNQIYMASAFLSPHAKYFNYASDKEKESFIKIGTNYIKQTWTKLGTEAGISATETISIENVKTPISTRSSDSFFGENYVNLELINSNTIDHEIKLVLEQETRNQKLTLNQFWKEIR